MSLNIEEAIKRLKFLVDNLRCNLCDKLDGVRLRYSCGHSACQQCVSTSDSCILCLTPPGVAHIDPIVDNSLTERARHTQILLNTFQDLFHVDVNKWCRLSNQLKAEKDFFPKCIQAPNKYSNINKRSSIHIENSQESYYPGEFIKPLDNSNMSFNFVQKWLDNNDKKFNEKTNKRKPFSDLNVNISSNSPIKKRADLILDRVKDMSENFNHTHKTKDVKNKHLKRVTPLKTYNKTNILTNRSKSSSILSLRINKQSETLNTFKVAKNEKEESGIEIDDDDDPIIIHDTQSPVIDKDKLAWLAVLEAEKQQQDSPSILRTEDSLLFKDNEKQTIFLKTPFYKKSKLYECCEYCKLEAKEANQEIGFKPVSITIENDTFTTTIKVMDDKNHRVNGKTSRSVQTDNTDMNYVQAIVKNVDDNKIRKSQDLFNDEPTTPVIKPATVNCPEPSRQSCVQEDKCVVIDSDSDTIEGSSSLQITADVHRSSEQNMDHGVLSELKTPRPRVKKRPRSQTPTSTDSSDKENRDPNKPRKSKEKKKRKS